MREQQSLAGSVQRSVCLSIEMDFLKVRHPQLLRVSLLLQNDRFPPGPLLTFRTRKKEHSQKGFILFVFLFVCLFRNQFSLLHSSGSGICQLELREEDVLSSCPQLLPQRNWLLPNSTAQPHKSPARSALSASMGLAAMFVNPLPHSRNIKCPVLEPGRVTGDFSASLCLQTSIASSHCFLLPSYSHAWEVWKWHKLLISQLGPWKGFLGKIPTNHVFHLFQRFTPCGGKIQACIKLLRS